MMIEIHRELRIIGGADDVVAALERIAEEEAGGWFRDVEREERFERNHGSRFYFFSRRDESGDVASTLWFAPREEREWYVANLISTRSHDLSYAEYNSILSDFYEAVVAPVRNDLDVEVRFEPGMRPLEGFVSERAADLLTAFAQLANRSTGSSHPSDQARWHEFIIAAHAESAELDAGVLYRWLTENAGWPDEKAQDLETEYEQARDLLLAYDDYLDRVAG